jgi:hypothetical protein
VDLSSGAFRGGCEMQRRGKVLPSVGPSVTGLRTSPGHS